MATLESQMEDALIHQLTQGVSQWTYREDLKCEEDLWRNLCEKLNASNIDRLNGIPLTDSEMEQVKIFIREQAGTTYKAARWLAGEHGVAQIPVTREDATLGSVSLIAINNREIAGGNSVYEVINQYRSPEDTGSDRSRRFDVTLLINGLPMIAIELKNGEHPFMDAFRQIRKYGEEGKFSGLMGLIQMFVVTNGSSTRYIAADNRGDINEKFLTRWVDEKNAPVEDYLAFARAALNIPLAHQMVGKYSVLDNDRKKLILLRPYQIHAIEAIRKASRERKSGYVWHTTGSGKTLTSFTVTKNLLDIPGIDKAIFLVDRKDLDQQTSTAFMSYADACDIDVQNTENTGELVKKLESRDRSAIVTTIQKLQTIIRRCTGERTAAAFAKTTEKLRSKSIAFIVDECHRAVTPETKRALEAFFSRSLWYGFTGTPIFPENKRAAKGDLAQTTGELFYSLAEWRALQGEAEKGKSRSRLENCLHIYTIKEAISDQSVLGFHFQTMGLDRDRFIDLATKLGAATEEEAASLELWELEKKVVNAYFAQTGKSLYDAEAHREQVVDYIVNRCSQKLRLNAPTGEAYEGLLTVGSIREAQAYYELFQKAKEEGRVSEAVKKVLPDFPKVAITYTVGENEDGATANQALMKKSLADYNAMFGTAWALDTLGAYNADLNTRLARKHSKYRNREEQLDLVIVVDRLLIGFDAPCLSTIFLDRSPMKPEHLIQAFSRTNRIFDATKRYGQIVSMRTPALYEKACNDALMLYSNSLDADIGFVKAPDWRETKAKVRQAVAELRNLAPTPADAVARMRPLEGAEKAELEAYAKALPAVDRLVGTARVYDEFRPEEMEAVLGISEAELSGYVAHYQNVVEELRKREAGDPEKPAAVDIEYSLECVKQIEVNFKYLVSLLQAYMPESLEAPRAINSQEDERIQRFIEQYRASNPRIAEILSQIWFELKMNPELFRGKDAFNVVKERIEERFEAEVKRFSAEWFVNPEALKAYARYTPASEVKPEAVNTGMGDFKAFKAAGGELSKLKYTAALRRALTKFVLEEIQPMLKV